MMTQIPLPEDVTADDLRIVRLLVRACAKTFHTEEGRWPTVCELLDFMARACWLSLDEPQPYCEAARWLAVGQAPEGDYGVVVLDPGPPGSPSAVVPEYVADEAEAWLAAQQPPA